MLPLVPMICPWALDARCTCSGTSSASNNHSPFVLKSHEYRNTQIIDTCIVFSSWHIRSTQGFIFSCLLTVALGICYEWLRAFQKQYDVRLARLLVSEGKGKGRATPGSSGRSSPECGSEESGLLNGKRVKKLSGRYAVLSVSFLSKYLMIFHIA